MNRYNDPSLEISLDFEYIFVNMIVGQILNNEEAKNNYVRILGMALLKVEDALSWERENDPR